MILFLNDITLNTILIAVMITDNNDNIRVWYYDIKSSKTIL